MTTGKRILVARTDRLGDVLLSLPALLALRLAFTDHELDFLVRSSYVDLLTPYLQAHRMRAVAFDRPGAWRTERYAAAVLLFDEPGLVQALWWAGVPVRVGAYSKLRSFLFLTKGKRQHRAFAEQNEAEYNLGIAQAAAKTLGAGSLPNPPRILLPVNEVEARKARALLASFGEAPHGWLVGHPGMGGSALNLSAASYRRVLEELERETSARVVLSLGPSERDGEMVTALRSARPDWSVVENQSLAVLAEVFRLAKLVIAPSTGPIHLAHYVGASTLGIYSPVRTHRPRRWEPWGGSGRSVIWVPEVDCPGTKDCLGQSCANYFCLDVMARGGLPSRLRNVLNDSSGGHHAK